MMALPEEAPYGWATPTTPQASFEHFKMGVNVGAQNAMVHTCDVTAVAISPDGAHVVSASWDRSIIVWNLDRRRAIAHISRRTHPERHPHGRHHVRGHLAKGRPDLLHELRQEHPHLEPPYRRAPRALPARRASDKDPGHKGEITCVTFMNSANRVVSCSDDRTIRIWDIPLRVPLCQLLGPRAHRQLRLRVPGRLVSRLLQQRPLHPLLGHCAGRRASSASTGTPAPSHASSSPARTTSSSQDPTTAPSASGSATRAARFSP